jgi:carbonic anhydrase/acetyltransferase-like protein (isoleucine patch superfamily)
MIIEYQGKRPKIASTAFIAPTAVVIGDVEIGEEASVWFGVVIRGDHGPIRIGARTNIQDNSIIHVGEMVGETVIADDVTIGHAAMMEDCVVESFCLIGMNAVVLNGARIGSGSIVAAGSVVGQNAEIPPGVLVAGAPAKVKKTLDETSARHIRENVAGYVELSRSYIEEGIGLETSR